MTGINMSTSEKHNEIMKLHEIHPDWSRRKIGRELKVDHKTVGKHRKASNGPQNMEEKKEQKETKDEIIKRLEKVVKEITVRLMETELKLRDSEEKNRVLMEEHAILIGKIKNQG